MKSPALALVAFATFLFTLCQGKQLHLQSRLANFMYSLLTFVSASDNFARKPFYDIETVFPHAPIRRALPNAPSGYAPEGGNCPSNRPSVRSAGKLSPNETSWLKTRRSNTVGAMRDLLDRLNISNFDAASYINDARNDLHLANIAIAASGGGYRAMLKIYFCS